MERVWEELKKIDAQAEQIRSEALTDAREITRLAQNQIDELLAKNKKYAQQETETIYESALSEANSNREHELVLSQQTIENLNKDAQKRMDKAAFAIFTAVLGEA